MRKFVLVTVAMVVLLSACGKKEANVTLGNTSASPGATGSAAAGTTAAPKGSTAPGTTKAPTSSSSTGTTNAPTPKPASQGGANPPKDGSYAYRLDGTSDSPQGGKQTYKNDTATGKVTHSGNQYSTEASSSAQSGSATTKTEWDPTQILLVSIKIDQGFAQFSCDYNPKPVIGHIPAKPETFPHQKLKGSGNACDGDLDIQVVGKENATDNTGKTWSTWKIHIKTVNHITYNGQKITANSDQTRWFSPDLGVEIKSTTDASQTIGEGAAAQKAGSSHLVTVLKSHP